MEESYKKLPTEWIILGESKRIIATNIGRQAMNAAMKTGHFYMAKCHYRIGENGKEYYVADNQIAELLERKVDPECPYDSPIVSMVRYGVVK